MPNQSTISGPEWAARPNERPRTGRKKPAGRSRPPKHVDDQSSGYDREVLPGLEDTRGLPAAAIPWEPTEPPRWWVRRSATAKAKEFSLMFGRDLKLTAEGLSAFHRLVREADFRNDRLLTCPPSTNN